MSEDKKHLAELFGLVDSDSKASGQPGKRKRQGRSVEESTGLGSRALQEGDTEEAIRHFLAALEQNDSFITRLNLAAAQDAAGMEDEAEANYRAAIELADASAEARAGLAEILRRSSRFREAVDQLERATAEQPANPTYHFKLSETLKEMRRLSDAVRAAERAALCSPDNYFYHYWLAELLIGMGAFEQALEPFKTAIDLSPGDDHLYVRSAIALWRSKRALESIKAMRMATDLSPKDAMYAAGLALLLREAGEEGANFEEVEARLDQFDREKLWDFAMQLGIQLQHTESPTR